MFARRAFKQGTGMITDTFFDGAAEDSLFGAEGLEPGETQTAALFEPGPILPSPLMQSVAAKVEIPEGQSVVHVAVAPGETVELPFGADAQFLVRLGDGNLAIKVGDVTIILEGYAEASGDPAHPIVIHSADGAPLDIASLLAATDPDIEIETAAGAGDPGGQGTDNTGAIFQQLDDTGDGADGTPGGAGAQDGTTGPAGGDPADAGRDPNQAQVQNDLGPVNAAPETNAAAATGLEDAVSIAVPLSGLDSDGFVALFTVTSLPAGGTLYADAALTVALAANATVPAVAGAATVYFVPDPNFNGAPTFQYAAIDNAGLPDATPATATITVTPVNDAPASINDTITVGEGGTTIIPVLANDTDAEGDPLTITVLTSPQHGTLVVNPDGTVTYQHDGSETTGDSFTYKANDGKADGNTATVSINVTPVNDAPVSTADSITVSEGGTATILAGGATSVLANDTDAEGNALTAFLVTGPANGTLLLNGNGTFSYTHNGGETTSDSFTYKANDGTASGNTVTVTITVSPVNDAPVAINDSYATNEDTALFVFPPSSVLENDTDADGNSLHAALVSGPAHGSLSLNSAGSLIYIPDANYHGSDSFTYKANDGTADSNIATVNITVASVNDAPTSSDDTYAMNEDQALTVTLTNGLLQNDSDDDGDALTAALVTGPGHGALTLNPNGSFTYTPDADYHGTDTFTYKANDGTENGNTATVHINVAAVNDTPVAVNDTYTTNEDTALFVFPPSSVLDNDSDADSDPLQAALVSGPAHGSLSLTPAGSLIYIPDANYHGSDSFTYKASDGTTDSNIATVHITVASVNDAPTSSDDSFAMNQDQSLTVPFANRVLLNDSDDDGDPLTAALVSNPGHGTLTLNPNGTFTYTPNAGYHGSDSFTYKANDGTTDGNTATVHINVAAVNEAPVAVADSITVAEGGTATVLTGGLTSVLANDTDAEANPLSAILVTGPTNGTLTLNPNGTFSYTHNGSETTTDSFTYKANDGTVDGNTTTVSITVSPVNDAPVATTDSYAMDEDQSLTVGLGNTILLNDTDAEGNALTAALVSGPGNGTLTLNPNGTFTYAPNADFHGTDSFTYKANDGTANSNTATVTITVNPVNDAPVAVADGITVAEGGTATILTGGATSTLTNDTDADANPLTAILVTGPVNGTLTLNTDGTFSYTHNGSETTTDSFTYKANDGTVDGNTTTVSITIIPVNDAPVATGDSYVMNENQSLTVTAANGLLLNDTDAEANALTVSVVSNPGHGSLTLSPNGSFTYTPNAAYHGSDSFTYKANDGTADGNTATVNITVEAVPNQAPVANTDSIIVAPGGTTTQLVSPVATLLFNDSDADSDPLTAILVQAPLHGMLTLNPNGTFSYTHDGGADLYDSFTYKANDGSADSNTATVFISVQQPNLFFPLAVNDSIVLDKGATTAALVGGAASVLANDSDMDPGSTLTAVLTFGAAHGSVTLNPDGTFSYTHNGGADLTDSFAYQVSDGLHLSMPAVVTIAINLPPPVDPGPTTTADNVFTNFGSTPFQIPEWMLLYNDVGKDATHLDVTGVAGFGFFPPVHTPGTGSDGYVTVTGDFMFGGSTFTYAATEGGVTGNTATVTVQTMAFGTITGSPGQDILIGTSGADSLNGGGSFGSKGDLIFAGDGDDSIFFHTQALFPIPGAPPSAGAGDVVYGGTDTVAKDNGLMAGLHGDVLVISELATDFTHGFKLDSIEGIRVDTSGMPYPHTITLNASNVIDMSDHTITPGGVYGGRDAIYINGGAVDHLYLSISDGGKWSDTGLTANDGLSKIYVHDTGAGAAGTSENAYVIVSPAIVVHPNQDA